MKKNIKLNEFKIEEIRELAREERQKLGFMREAPIAHDMSTILDNLNIILLEYPIKSENERQAFSAAMIYSEEGNKELVFIGLNTADYFDKQLFAIAHELYHYYTKTGSHLSRLEIEENIVESKANRFAAEFLLPESTLKSIVVKEFKTSTLKDIQFKTIVRFIARLQCTWWLPYRSLVKRLWEINAITDNQYEELYRINERNLDSDYGKVGMAINREVFKKLNTATNTIGTSAKDIEVIIRNFEDNIIDEDMFANTLKLFEKTPDDFGYSIAASEDDLDELDSYFNEDDNDES
jgi:Zn-dependent peptidase ImmA (M78 family)